MSGTVGAENVLVQLYILILFSNLVANISTNYIFKWKYSNSSNVDYFRIFGNVLEKSKIRDIFYYLSLGHLELNKYLIVVTFHGILTMIHSNGYEFFSQKQRNAKASF